MMTKDKRSVKKGGKSNSKTSANGNIMTADKLQKKMFKLGRPLHQAAGALSFAYAIYCQAFVVDIPEDLSPTRMKFGGPLKYLTFLNMVLQLVFFTLAFISNFTGKKSMVTKVKDVMFASAAFPIGMFVGIIFWSIWAVDRELIFPVRFDAFFPSWLNHLMHTTVLPLQLGELVLAKHTYPSRKLGGAITAGLTLAYLVWINVIFYLGGFWVYPVFKVLSLGQRIVFMGFCSGMGGVLYLAGEAANNMVRGGSRSKTE